MSLSNDALKPIMIPSFDPIDSADWEPHEQGVLPQRNDLIAEPQEQGQSQDLPSHHKIDTQKLPHLGAEAYESVRDQLYKDIQPMKEEILAEAKRAKEALIEEGRQEKERLLQTALRELEEKKAALLEQAQEEARDIKRRAHEEGKREGVLQGKREIENEAKGQLETLKAVLKEMSLLKPKIVAECERDIVELAVQVAQKILQRELQIDPGAVLDLASRALKEFEGRSGGIRVKLNPDDHDFIVQLDPKILEDKGLSDVVFEKDPSLQRGGCLLETYQGRVDARIEKQLEIIKKRLLEKVDHA